MLITQLFRCTQEYFDNLKTTEKVPLYCPVCNKDFSRLKKKILENNKKGILLKHCSNKCQKLLESQKATKECFCRNCFKSILKKEGELRKSKNTFCSKSCSAIFNNKNKTTGVRRSKLEIYLEKQLTEIHSNFEIIYSNKQIIGSELDIFIPSLKLAFEIQGIFHYEPIFGQEKLERIQKNDLEKIQKCNELGINLILIDTRDQKRFSEESSKKYLNEINKHILINFNYSTQ